MVVRSPFLILHAEDRGVKETRAEDVGDIYTPQGTLRARNHEQVNVKFRWMRSDSINLEKQADMKVCEKLFDSRNSNFMGELLSSRSHMSWLSKYSAVWRCVGRPKILLHIARAGLPFGQAA